MRNISFFLLLFLFTKSYAQVNLPTGSATFNLPIFNWQDSKSRLQSSIALSYSSGSGLSVNSVASNLGQGWNVIEGGVISRIQAGEPDDQKPYEGTGTSGDVTKYPAGFLYDVPQAPGYSNTLTKYPIYKDKNHIYKQHNNVAADKQLDQFAFSFNGRSGIFILGKGASGRAAPVFLGDTKLKAWYDIDESLLQQNIRTTITAFHIQDEQGLVYTFSKKELTKVLKIVYTDKNEAPKLTQPNLKSGNVYYEKSIEAPSTEIYRPYIVTAWYLQQIEDPLTGRTLDFTYDTLNIQAEAGTSMSYYSKDYSIITHSVSYSQTPQISQIAFPDGHKVEFNYGEDRVDLTGDKILTGIAVKYTAYHHGNATRFLAKYSFKSKYVIKKHYSNSVLPSEEKLARLYLISITKLGPDLKEEEKPYHFDYYLGSSAAYDFVPPPFYHLKDIWGYYNGDNSKSFSGVSIDPDKSIFKLSNSEVRGLCFLRSGSSGITLNPKDGYAKNGLIHQITFPTGSSLIYDYEQNKTILNGQLTTVGGVHVSKTTMTDGGYSNDCNNPISTNYKYTLADGVQPSYWGVESPVTSLTIKNYYKPEKKRFKLFSLSCKYQYQYPGILARENSVSLTNAQKILAAVSDVMGVVGTVSQILDIIQVASPGTGPAAVIIDAICDIVNIVVTCFINPSKTTTMTIYYNSDMNAINPLPVQFKRVEVTEGTGANGKTVNEYTSSDDYPIWFTSNPVFSMKQRYAYWAYGLPKESSVYDNAGNILEETDNLYDTTFVKRLISCPNTDTSHSAGGGALMRLEAQPMSQLPCDSPYISYKNLILKNSSQRSDVWDDPATYNSLSYTADLTSNADMKVDKYYAYTGRMLLNKTIKKVYKKGYTNQYQQTTVEYTYNNADNDHSTNYEVNEVKTTQSNGDINYQTFRYDNTLLNQNSITTIPFETTTSFQKAGSGTRYYTSESVTEYITASNGNIVPYQQKVQRFSTPQPASSMNFYVSSGSSTPVYAVPQYFTYDSYGNNTGITDEGGRSVVKIYDADEKFVLATIINAIPGVDKVAYKSFESDDFSHSGWTFSGSPAYSTTAAVTGTHSLTLSSGKTLSASLTTTKAYTLSFWATSGLTVSGGATLTKSSPTISGFTYYEYKISQGTASISITGSGNIDEARLYPANARIETTTYDPVLGKTASCDQNSRVTYYEYDNLGRMRFIKDENRNIVKMFEYNQKSTVTTCISTYENLAISEVFTKNNCSAGYIGSDVIYIIPAGKYTSTISQEEIDAKVEAELAANGQAYANANGTCIQVFTNDAMSQSFTKEGCDDGYKGTSVTYSVAAGTYSSTVSKQDANDQAQAEIDANGQAYANADGVASCIVDTDPDFTAEEDAPTQCQQSGGVNTGHLLVLTTDINPHSSTYNQTQWGDMGSNTTACPLPPCTNCTAQGYKCVNGICELGFKVYTNSECVPGGGQQMAAQTQNLNNSLIVHPDYSGYCQLTYHYEWSDGSWSQNYTESGGGCSVGGSGCPIPIN